MWYKPKKQIFFFGLISFFNDISSEMVFSILPAFFVSTLKASVQSIGILEGVVDFISHALKIYSGHLSDVLQKRKKIMFFGYSLSVLTRPFYILSTSIYIPFFLRIIDRVGKGLRESPRDALLSLSVPEKELRQAFNFQRAFDITGGIVGPLIGYVLLSHYPQNFSVIFITSFIFGLAALITIPYITEVVGIVKKDQFAHTKLKDIFIEHKHYFLGIIFLSVCTIPVAIIVLQAYSFGLLLSAIPLLYVVYNTSGAFFSYMIASMSTVYTHAQYIMLGYIILGLSYVLLIISTNWYGVIVALVSLGLFASLTEGTYKAMSSEKSLPGNRGTMIGLTNACYGIGLFFGGVLSGVLWHAVGSTITLTIFIFTLIAVLIYIRVTKSLEYTK
ncbi:MAG: MFS transporter [Alphaproteobacteria bacterium]|nr:MFS transporter [Alphaproteobacteria bacterium]